MNTSQVNELLTIEVLAKDFANKINEAGFTRSNFINLVSVILTSGLKIEDQKTYDQFDKEFFSLRSRYN